MLRRTRVISLQRISQNDWRKSWKIHAVPLEPQLCIDKHRIRCLKHIFASGIYPICAAEASYVCMYIYIYSVYIYIHAYTVFTNIYIRTYHIYIYLYMHVYIYVYIYIFTISNNSLPCRCRSIVHGSCIYCTIQVADFDNCQYNRYDWGISASLYATSWAEEACVASRVKKCFSPATYLYIYGESIHIYIYI